MIKSILTLLLILFIINVNAQPAFSAKKITAVQLPKTIRFKGDMHEAWTWKDKLGENILITSTVGPFEDEVPDPDTEEIGGTKELHAFHFIKKDTAFKLLWKISDSEKSCSFDITADFIKGALQITDLDKDGIAETTIQYKLTCRSDVSPAAMKLIMHEDSVKYALRGRMWIKSGLDSKFTVTEQTVNLETLKGYKAIGDESGKREGRYQTEQEFKNAPKEFLVFARRQWMKYVKESFD